jgi:H+/Cl- antiporter ClcA
MADVAAPAPDPAAMLRSRSFLVLLALACVVGLGVSLASWGFLELVHQIQVGVFTDLPKDVLGYDNGTPLWFYLPVLAVAGVLTALAIARLPGRGGHVPADGLNAGVIQPGELPGLLLAAFATIGLGVVLGPEAPLLGLGGALGLFAIRRIRSGAPQQVEAVVAATGSFAAVSMIFDSPIIAAVILIEAAGLGGPMLPVILLPGLLGAGIGSLVATGMGSWTGLDTSDFSLGQLPMPAFPRPDVADFGWAILLAIAVAIVAWAIMQGAQLMAPAAKRRPFLLLPAGGLVVAGLAIAFAATTDKGAEQVLFSGQDSLSPLVSQAATWSLSALALLILFKGLAWCVSLSGFRGGPTFPALFLGAAAGVLASHLPGFDFTPAVGVGMAAGVAAVLRLPLSAVVLGVLLTGHDAIGAAPLMIIGVVIAYLVALTLDRLREPAGAEDAAPAVAAPAADPAKQHATA